MSVSLQPVPNHHNDETDAGSRDPIARAEHEAAEIIARARRQAEAIVAEASGAARSAPNPLAALGDNAEEIIGQVRKLIGKQRQLQTEREEMLATIESLKSERDELVQRLTDAVERMEELAKIADGAQNRPSTPGSPMKPPPPPMYSYESDQAREEIRSYETDHSREDTSLAARLRQAEKPKTANEDTSLAARLRQAEEAEQAEAAASASSYSDTSHWNDTYPPAEKHDADDQHVSALLVGADRSFYDRHSAKLPRLEGGGGRSVLSAIGDMRPESEPKGRKGRRRAKK